MTKPIKEDRLKLLYKAFLTVENYDEFNALIHDLCTPQEIHIISERLVVALLLEQKAGSYKKISEESDASLVTVTRVARFLKHEPYGGYRTVFKKIKL
jgi:TrpR-related protein YerC/YecD